MTGKHRKTIREISGDAWEGVFYFDPKDDIYREHFPGYPVVPGSVIVHAFLQAVQESGILEDYLTLESFRFREFLSPGHHTFRIDRQEDRLNCLIYRDSKKLVTGVLRR